MTSIAAPRRTSPAEVRYGSQSEARNFAAFDTLVDMVMRRSGEARHGETTGRATAQAAAELDLQQYFPYRLARLAEQVSLAVAEVYSERFSLTRQEWRVLAILGARQEVATKEIGPLTTLDKMQVSRAVQGLETRGIASRKQHPDDRRELIVSLTSAGRAIYRKIVPYARERETALLAVLTAEEAEVLDRAMRKMSAALTQGVGS